jgi:hypothetical protein
MKNNFKNILIAIAAIGFLTTGCVNDTFEPPKTADCVDPGITKTKEVSQLWSSAPTNGSTVVYHHLDADGNEIPDYVEAIVVSSDEGGNFYKSMYLQPVDGSKGFNLSIDEVNAYTKDLQPGRRVFLKINGLAYANPTSFARGLIIGSPPTEQFAVDRIPGSQYKAFLTPTCEIVNEDNIVHKITLAQALSDTYLNTLVEISDVQFKSDCSTYSKFDFDTTLKITSNGTQTLDIRTSHFANFAGQQVPSGRGTIRGVLTKYSSNTGYQLILRTERDVKMTGERVVAATPAKGGTAIVYSGALSENFESYATTTGGAVLPKYINDVTVGTKYWDVVSFSNNKYLQTSAFNNGCLKAYFVVPVDFTAANTFSFKTLDGYFDKQPLKVYYSTNYVPGGEITPDMLVDITSKFTLASGDTSGYASTFTSSGAYTIPAELTGNGYFIFEYDGTNGATTTMQIDNIVIN